MKIKSLKWVCALVALVASIVLIGCDAPTIDMAKVAKDKGPSKTPAGPPGKAPAPGSAGTATPDSKSTAN